MVDFGCIRTKEKCKSVMIVEILEMFAHNLTK